MLDLHSSEKFKNRKIKIKDKREIQPQDIFLDSCVLKNKEKGELDRMRIGKIFPIESLHFLFLVSLLVLSVLFLRSFQLQVIYGEDYSSKSDRNRYNYMMIDSSRGVIYDVNGNALVVNRHQYDLVYVHEENNNNWTNELKEFSEILNINYEEVKQRIDSSEKKDLIVFSDLQQKELVILEVKTRDIDSWRIDKKPLRNYVDAEIFSHIVGYTGKISPEELALNREHYSINDYVGKSGIEKFYEEELRVVPGKLKVERDALGRAKSEEIVSLAESGNNLTLWIDGGLQRKAYESLEKTLDSVGSKSGALIAMDPRTGGIMAMVSYPGFDSNIFSSVNNQSELSSLFSDSRQPLFNRIISGTYAVGSTIKPLIGLAALEENTVSPEKQFYSSGRLVVPNPWNPSSPAVFLDNAAHGWVNLKKAIAVSSNVYFYIVGGGFENHRGLGVDSIKKYLSLFSWDTETGIDLHGEKKGFIPSPEWKRENIGAGWTVGDTYNLSIGQGYLQTTPLQVVTAFSAVVNGGKLIKPMIVKEITGSNGTFKKNNETEVVRENFVSSENLKEIKEAMRETVLSGSATTLNGLPVSSGAKTGTAQIPKPGHYHNWITVFAPYNNPEIVLTVLVEEVEGVRAAAGPIAKEVLEWYFNEQQQ